MDEAEAKREFITGYFDELEERIEFLTKLDEEGHEVEARTLCLVYIDGLSNWLHLPDKDSPKNFSQGLMKYSGNRQFSLVLPEWLLKALPWKNAPKGLQANLEKAVGSLPPDEAYLLSEFLELLKPKFTADVFQWLEREVWRGTIANGVYTSLRSPGVDWGGVGHGISFSSTYHGDPIPRIDFHNLHPALVELAVHARAVSEETGDWFGVA